jgi:glutamine cyclotransferase
MREPAMFVNSRFRFAAAATVALSAGLHAQQPATSTTNTDYIAVQSKTPTPNLLTVQVLADFPHDTQAFTQGLLLHDGVFLESTGQYTRSQLREVDISSGAVIRSLNLPPNHFGEGLARVDDRLIQITWREGTAHVWNRETFEKITEFQYTGEGWGIDYDGTHLVMSNGSDKIRFRDPETFEIVREISVTTDGQPVTNINELEIAEGLIWANIWLQDFIVGIDPETGVVRSVVDARPLRALITRTPGAPIPEALNGIAYNEAEGTFYLTGKYWPKVFEVQFINAQ